jgi:hypothetical protein
MELDANNLYFKQFIFDHWQIIGRKCCVQMATPTSNNFSKCAGKIYACMCFNGGGGVSEDFTWNLNFNVKNLPEV